MKLLTSIIDTDTIHVNREQFNPDENSTQIEALAHTIASLGGSISIPVAHFINQDNYELRSGYLEFYAYLKAREINSELPDRITVFLSDNKNEDKIQQQQSIINKFKNTKSSSKAGVDAEIDLRINNLEESAKNDRQRIFDKIEDLRSELLTEFSEKLPKPLPPLEALNRVSEDRVAHSLQRKLEFLGVSKAKKIVAKLQEVSKNKSCKSYQNFSEVLEVLRVPQKGRTVRLISKEKFLDFLDRWND